MQPQFNLLKQQEKIESNFLSLSGNPGSSETEAESIRDLWSPVVHPALPQHQASPLTASDWSILINSGLWLVTTQEYRPLIGHVSVNSGCQG